MKSSTYMTSAERKVGIHAFSFLPDFFWLRTKNELVIIRHFGKIVQFVGDLERATVFADISISLLMANHDLTQLDNCTFREVVKVPS